MLIAFIKFLHMLLTLSLCGAIIYAIVLVTAKKFALNNIYQQQKIYTLNWLVLGLGLLAILTGTLLVYPKNFTFHTVWIQSAYLLVTLFLCIIGLLLSLARRQYQVAKPIWLIVYLILGSILFIAIHDAVTKAPLLS
jgi:hypothetical protein